MTARYSYVYLTPNPPFGTRYLVGALLDAGGTVRFVRAPTLPCTACLGEADAGHILLALERLEATSSFDILDRFGPSMSSYGPRDLPFVGIDAGEWLVKTMTATP